MSDTICGGTKRNGQICTRPAGWGTDHSGAGSCKNHGGCTPTGQQHGGAILAKRQLAAWAQPVPIAPHDALLKMVAFANGWFDYASSRVNELLETDLVGPVVTTTDRPLKDEGGAEHADVRVEEVRTSSPQLHIWIRARDEAADDVARYSKMCIEAGIAERLVRLAQQQAQMLATAMQNFAAALGVADHPDMPKIARRELERAAGYYDDITDAA